MEDFYIKCNSREESELCEKWAITNNLRIQDHFGYTDRWNIFVVKDNYYTLNYKNYSITNMEDICINLPEKTLADLGIGITTKETITDSKEEFKVGDWIYIIKADKDENYKSKSKFNGDVLKILSFEKETDISWRDSYWLTHEGTSFSGGGFRVGGNGWIPNVHFRKATPEEIASVTKPKEITEYAGLKIGDKLPRNIICDWGEIGINKYSDGWIQAMGMFISDRYIKSFKELDGIVGFLVSGTDNVYLKADGFKEFMNSYSRPINTQPIKTTSEQYDLSTTITRAVKNNDPSIIARETGKSIDELCNLVDEKTTNCLSYGDDMYCPGLKCSADNCPFSQFNGKTKESAKAWLRGKSKQSLPDYQAVHVDSQEKWDFVSEKLGYTSRWPLTFKWDVFGSKSCINLNVPNHGTKGIAYKNVISFEDWLDLTGYRSGWDIFNAKTISAEDYIGTDLLIPKECSNPISQSSYPVITDPFAPIVELE